MATPTLDLGSYSPSELQALLTAAKAEYLARITGVVQQGSSAAQSYGMQRLSDDALVALINAITAQLGLNTFTNRVTPNFNVPNNCATPWGP